MGKEVVQGCRSTTGVQDLYSITVVQVLYTCACVQEYYKSSMGTGVVQVYRNSTGV
jgi:hypothetical protein